MSLHNAFGKEKKGKTLRAVSLSVLKTIWWSDAAKLALLRIRSELWWISLVAALCSSLHEGIYCCCCCTTVTWRTFSSHTHTFLSHKWKGRSLIFPSQKAGTLVFTFQSLHHHHYSNSFSYSVVLCGRFSVIPVVCNVQKIKSHLAGCKWGYWRT